MLRRNESVQLQPISINQSFLRINITTYNISKDKDIFNALLKKIKSKKRSIYLLQEVPRMHVKTLPKAEPIKLCSANDSGICMLYSADIAKMIGNEIGANEKYSIITLHTSKGDIDVINFHGYAKSNSDTENSKFQAHIMSAYAMRTNKKYIIAGDFNREPFDEHLAGKFGFYGRRHVCDLAQDSNSNINISWKFMSRKTEPFGTIFYDNMEALTRWGVYDQFILSQELYNSSKILNSQILRKISTIDCFSRASKKVERNTHHLPVNLTLEIF